VQRPERRAQVCERASLIGLRPQQRGERVAAVGLARHGQVGQQRDRLAPADLDAGPVQFDARRAEKKNA